VKTRFVLLLAALLAVLIAGCGSGSSSGDLRRATLVLDYLPNGVHAGVYRALAAGYYEDRGIDLHVVSPTSTADTLRLIQAGKADFGLADGIDIAGQIDAGREAKGIMALTQRPSGGLISLASSRIDSPADLAGKTVGVTGVPSDSAVFDTMVRKAGGDPDDSKVVTVGFNGAQALQAGKIAAFTGYVPADATAIEARGQETRSFAFDKYGGPSYPGLVFFSTTSKIDRDADLMSDFVDATTEGYRDAIDDPGRAVDDLAEQVESIDPDLALATFRAYEPLFGDPAVLGRFNRSHIRDLSAFLLRNGLIEKPISPARFGENPDRPL
jgi:NitT/TauT family transport system substrate-binding protein/putative hydroxymethylpyrimidine transport system substrate-binding protein